MTPFDILPKVKHVIGNAGMQENCAWDKMESFYVGRLFLHQVLDVGTLNVGFSIFAETIFIIYITSIEYCAKNRIGQIG